MDYKELVEEFGFDMWPKSDRVQGRIGSAKPAWYSDGLIEEQIREVENQKAQLAGGGVSPEQVHRIRQQVARDEATLSLIRDTFPRPEGVKRDMLHARWKELGVIISDSMYSHSDMDSGRANPHEEVRRAKDPILPVSREAARWVIYCNGNVVKDKDNQLRIKRDDAVRAWQIAGKILGESTWTEDLRPQTRVEGRRPSTMVTVPRGFDQPDIEAIEIPDEFPTFNSPELPDGADLLKDEEPEEETPQPETTKPARYCADCGVDITGGHHMAKRCKPCKELKDGRKNTHKNVGGGT